MADDPILDDSHYCDHDRDENGQHRNDSCDCACSLCFSFWHWNVRRFEEARKVRASAAPPSVDTTEGDEMKLIRTTHPYGFRSGEWATLRGVVPADGRECYLVEFPDGKTDFWAVDDPQGGYEFAELQA